MTVSIISSIPENVIHFNNQVCLFKCSKRFINKQDFASQSVEMSEEEEREEEEEEEDEEDKDEKEGEEEDEIEEDNESDEEESENEEEEEDEEEEHEDGEEESEKEDDESEEDGLISDIDDRLFSVSSIPSDHVVHFDDHTILFKNSKRFFNHGLTLPPIKQLENESRKEGDDYDEVEEEQEEEVREEGEGEDLEGKGSEDSNKTSGEVYTSSSVVVGASNYNGEENHHTVTTSSLTQKNSHTLYNVPVSTLLI